MDPTKSLEREKSITIKKKEESLVSKIKRKIYQNNAQPKSRLKKPMRSSFRLRIEV